MSGLAQFVGSPSGAFDTSRASRLDRVLEVILVLLLAYQALAFGGVLASGHFVFVAAVSASAAIVGARLLIAPRTLVWSWAFVPIAAFAALVALQLVPIPIGLVERLAPRTAGLWLELLGEPPLADGAPRRVTLSLYPHATREELRLLLAGLALVFVVVDVVRSTAALRRVLLGIAAVGALVVGLALAQDVTGATRLYWTFETPGGTAGGPFVHYGHFSQFVNLSLGCAIALFFVRAAERRPGRSLGIETWRGATGLDHACAVLIVLGILAIALSMSRGGLISLVFAGAVTATALHRTRFFVGGGWPLVGLLFVAFLSLLAIGFDPVYERFSTLTGPVEEYAGRYELVRDTLSMTASFPVLGTGLGTFAVAFPMFDAATRLGTATHAENLYAETLAETGVVGFALMLAIGGAGVLFWTRSVRTRRRPADAAAFGIGFGLIAVAFHAVCDFGLKVPAIGALTAVLVALLAVLSGARVAHGRVVVRAVGAGAILFAALLAALLPGAYAAWRAQLEWNVVEGLQSKVLPPRFAGTAQDYAELLASARRAFELQPSNVEYGFWYATHGWHAALAAASGYTATASRPTDVRTPELVERTAEVHARLLELRRVCPTYGPLWSIAGQLGVVWLDDSRAGEWIHRGRELAPHHPTVLLASAGQSIREGDEVAALATLQSALLAGAKTQAIVDLLIVDFDRPALALEIARGDASRLLYVRNRLSSEDGAPILEEVGAALQAELASACAQPGAEAWMFAELGQSYLGAGEPARAIPAFRSLLVLEPDHRLRFELAQALVANGETDEARRQLRDHLGIHPGHRPSLALLEALGR